MEEKRYKLESYNEAFCEIHDTEKDEWYIRKDLIADLLNQQDNRIKELEEENLQLKHKLAEKEKEIDEFKRIGEKCHLNDLLEDKRKENKILIRIAEQLIQSQKQLAISELEKVKTKFNSKRPIDELASEVGIELGYTSTQINNFVENKIKELEKKE